MAAELEKAIRQNAGLIVDKMLQAAPEGDEAKDAEVGPDDFMPEEAWGRDRRQKGRARQALSVVELRGVGGWTCWVWPRVISGALWTGVAALARRSCGNFHEHTYDDGQSGPVNVSRLLRQERP